MKTDDYLEIRIIIPFFLLQQRQKECSSYFLFGLLISSSYAQIWSKAPPLLPQGAGAEGREGVGDLGKNRGYCSEEKPVEEMWAVVVDRKVHKDIRIIILRLTK